MKMEITHLKAPWPEGTQVGDVLEMGDGPAPAWALGKFKPAADGAKVTPQRKPAAESKSDEKLTVAAKDQREAETIDQQAQREREEADTARRTAGQTAPHDGKKKG